MKLFQLMVEHPVEDETVDWTKIEPSVSLLKSPKGDESGGFGNLPGGLGCRGWILEGVEGDTWQNSTGAEAGSVSELFFPLQTTWMTRRGISGVGH